MPLIRPGMTICVDVRQDGDKIKLFFGAQSMRDSGCDDLALRQESGGQAEVPSRDGAGSATVRHALGRG